MYVKARGTYRDLKVHELLCPGAHLVVEAEPVLADIIRREHKITLLLLLALQNDTFLRSHDFVIDIEGSTGLNLHSYPLAFCRS